MEDESTTLDKVAVGEACSVENLEMFGIMRRHLQDLGMIFDRENLPNQEESFQRPEGYRMRNSFYAIRQEDAY